MIPGEPSVFLFVAVATAFLIGVYGERARAKLTKRRWRKPNFRKWDGPAPKVSLRAQEPLIDSVEQLRVVMAATFQKRRLLSRSEARVFEAAERIIERHGLTWRVMAQVSLGEVLSSPDARAYSTINSKRVDMLLVSQDGDPIAAVEYQGGGHYQGAAPARDAVKKEALRRAGVQYIEVVPGHKADHLAREIARIAAGAALKSSIPDLGELR